MTIMMTTTTMIMMIICMSGTVNSYSSSPLVTRFKSCRTISNKRCFILIIAIIIIIIIITVVIVITYNHDQGTFSDSEDDGVGGNVYQRQGFIIRAPNLK